MPRAMVRAKTVNFLPDFEAECMIMHDLAIHLFCSPNLKCTEIGKKAWLFAKLQPGRARKRINAT